MELSSFPLFPFLPTELRLKIWTYSMPQAPALLPRTYTAAHLRRTCRESRLIHNETFVPFFLPSAREQFTHAISLYGNPRCDDTLYLDDINSITRDFKEWIVAEMRGVGDDAEGAGRGIMTRLAVRDEMWKMKSARGAAARLEGGTGDLRFMMFHPESGLNSLEVLTLVLTGGVLSSGCRRGSGGASGHCIGAGGSKEEEQDGRDQRRLVKCEELFLEDKKVGGDVRVVLRKLSRLNNLQLGQGWREPELDFARIVIE